MPLVDRVGPYRLHFWSADRDEPPHVHVERDLKTAKFWLEPVRLASYRNFSLPELRKVERIVKDREATILKVWNDRFTR